MYDIETKTRTDRIENDIRILETQRNRAYMRGDFPLVSRLDARIKMRREVLDSCRPRPVLEMLDQDKIEGSGVVKALVELYLGLDFVDDCLFSVKEAFGRMGIDEIWLNREVKEYSRKISKFVERILKADGDDPLTELIVGNEQFVRDMHTITRRYIITKHEQLEHGQGKNKD